MLEKINIFFYNKSCLPIKKRKVNKYTIHIEKKCNIYKKFFLN